MRRKAGLSQDQAAEKLFRSPRMIQRYEAGSCLPPTSVLSRMMDCYQCEAADLLISPENIAEEPQIEAAFSEESVAYLYQYSAKKMPCLFSTRASYGIVCRQLINGQWVTVAVAAPFSYDFEAVSSLAHKCTELQLSPEHLMDVVSDFISQSTMIT